MTEVMMIRQFNMAAERQQSAVEMSSQDNSVTVMQSRKYTFQTHESKYCMSFIKCNSNVSITKKSNNQSQKIRNMITNVQLKKIV